MNDFLKHNLANQLAFLLRQVENVDKDFLKKRPIPQKWSIKEHLAHLGRYQEIFLERIAVILRGETPYLERYRADDDPIFYDWCHWSSATIIEKTILDRQTIIDLMTNLSKIQIAQIGVHPKLGRMNVEDWTNFFLLHESHHIYAIFGLKHRFYITEN